MKLLIFGPIYDLEKWQFHMFNLIGGGLKQEMAIHN